MRHCLIICALFLAACGAEIVPSVPPDLLTPCDGWTGPAPVTEGDFVSAVLAERRGRLICNGQLQSIADLFDAG